LYYRRATGARRRRSLRAPVDNGAERRRRRNVAQ